MPSCSRVPPERTRVSSAARRAVASCAPTASAVASSSPKLPPKRVKSQQSATGPDGRRHTVTARTGA